MEPATTPAPTEVPDVLGDAYASCDDPGGIVTRFEGTPAASDSSFVSAVEDLAEEDGVTGEEFLRGVVRDTATYSADEGTLVVRGAFAQGSDGELSGTGTLAGLMYQCLVDELGVPERVAIHISSTRAVDGTQTDSWDGLEGRWTYHPDSGLNITVWVSAGS